MSEAYERRTYPCEVRIADDEPGTPAHIVGHAALYDVPSEELWPWEPKREIIRRGAFDDVISDDVRSLVNHDPNYVLGRTKSGTLRVSLDDRGLMTDTIPPDTQWARDYIVTMRRGDVDQMSFGFSVKEEDEDSIHGERFRIIVKLKRLFDISPVTFPAYPQTDVTARRLRALGLDPARLDIRTGSIARAFLETFRENGYEECPSDDCPMKQASQASLPDAVRKVVPASVASVAPAGAVSARLRDLELRDRDLNFYLGSYR